MLLAARDQISTWDPRRPQPEGGYRSPDTLRAVASYKHLVVSVDAANNLVAGQGIGTAAPYVAPPVKLKHARTGNVSALAILPLNRSLLFGCDDGQILVCH